MRPYSAILTITCLTSFILIMYCAWSSGVACFPHDISLTHLGDNAPLLFELKTNQSECSILSVEIDYGVEGTDKVKTDLVRQFEREKGNEEVLVDAGADPKISLAVTKGQLQSNDGHFVADDSCLTFSMKADIPSTPLRACVKIEQGVHWYNAFEIYFQDWPMEKMIIQRRPMITDQRDNHAVAEPYFLILLRTYMRMSLQEILSSRVMCQRLPARSNLAKLPPPLSVPSRSSPTLTPS
uniref:Uncharacterized protein n=1 Tax=Cacopsylla melanoneura TaxID=428564 RepID=A0A8D8Q4J0_9HEMI